MIFVASAAASAYLTVSEIFPLEIRGMAIAIFFALGTLVGGVGAPLLFGWIIGTGSSTALFIGIFGGGGVNDFCGGDGSMDRRGRRATLARAHRRTVVEQRAVICNRVSVRRVTNCWCKDIAFALRTAKRLQ